MVVNHELWTSEHEHLIAQWPNAFRVVEIGTNYKIGLLNECVGLGGLHVIYEHIACPRHPRQEIGKSIGDDDLRLFAK